ncbi:Maelstrom domain containing protein [Aphelenchoides avenae]|nr:Maelstrom domain containing protein [Aphelenchus avenae]
MSRSSLGQVLCPSGTDKDASVGMAKIISVPKPNSYALVSVASPQYLHRPGPQQQQQYIRRNGPRRFNRTKRGPKLPKQPEKKYEEFDDDDDYDEDFNFGPVTETPKLEAITLAGSEVNFMKDKHKRDKQRLLDFLDTYKLKNTTSFIKKIRFLFVSVQTYGSVDGVVIPAELALNEFDLEHGIIDRYSTIVGTPQPLSEIQKYRVQYHVNETHRIPVDLPRNQNKLFEEILGRTEPTIAVQQGLRVGLYRSGLMPFQADGRNLTEPPTLASGPDGRRWLICLQHEFHDIRESLEYLKNAKGLSYEGFPVTEDRFIFAHTFVEAMAEFACGSPKPGYEGWLDSFGKPQQAEFETPWERHVKIFCKFHAGRRNHCCASATAARSCFAMFFALEEAYDLEFGD